MKLGWRAWLGFAVTGLLLWWVFRGVDFAAVVQEVRGADFGLLALAVAMNTAGFLLRAVQWRVLLHPLRAGTSLRSRRALAARSFEAALPPRSRHHARNVCVANAGNSRSAVIPSSFSLTFWTSAFPMSAFVRRGNREPSFAIVP